MIIIGLGTGRCGTQSLAHLLNLQKNAIVTHEKNPDDITWKGSQDIILSNLKEFELTLQTGKSELSISHLPGNKDAIKKIENITHIEIVGDVGFYYLKYVDIILQHNPSVKFICLQRDEEDTVQSYINKSNGSKRWSLLEKIGIKRNKERNHWIDHDGTIWEKDVIWDKCYPKYNASTKEDALHMYWRDYYQTFAKYEAKHPQNMKMYNVDSFNSKMGQKVILEFVGISLEDMVFQVGLKKNITHA